MKSNAMPPGYHLTDNTAFSVSMLRKVNVVYNRPSAASGKNVDTSHEFERELQFWSLDCVAVTCRHTMV